LPRQGTCNTGSAGCDKTRNHSGWQAGATASESGDSGISSTMYPPLGCSMKTTCGFHSECDESKARQSKAKHDPPHHTHLGDVGPEGRDLPLEPAGGVGQPSGQVHLGDPPKELGRQAQVRAATRDPQGASHHSQTALRTSQAHCVCGS
jgi:hypothetical protein